MPDHPILYYRDANSKSTLFTLDELIFERPEQVIQFNSKDIQIESITSSGDENTVNEPEIGGGDSKIIHKQSIGALPEGITLMGNINLDQVEILRKLRRFYNMKQVDYNFSEFGKIGFFSGVPYFDIDPTDRIAYTVKPPTISWTLPQKQVAFKIELLFGGMRDESS